VRFGWVNVDAGYGKDPAFLRALDDLGETFVAGVHASQRFWADCPWPAVPRPGGRGRTAKRPRAVGQAVSVAAWTAAQPPAAWRPMALRAGTKGEVRVEFLHARVYLWDGEEPTPLLWHLLVRRALDAKGQPQDLDYAVSNAPADMPATRLVAQASARYFIERSFQDAKSHLGLADYQVRGWRGWHHHVALVMLAMVFELRERMLHAETAPLLSCADVVALLVHFLPRRATTAEAVLEQLRHRHRQRQASIDSAARNQTPKEEPHETP
jgi:SRSO17 transposase